MPLSPESKDVIAATLPAVGAAIGDITSLFYSKMFAAHPELERDLFNRGNQKQGEQQKALAGSIAAFATLQLDPDPARVEAILSRVAHKHASLGIKPDEYWIVHKHLFEAIVEILGEAVTPEVAKAWDELYWLMADTLISMEADLYRAAGVEAGDVWRTVRVADRVHQSADTVSFVLTSLDGSPLPTFRPGQYLSVGVHLPDGARQIRQYSLSSAPAKGDWRITVKRVLETTAPDGTVLPAGEVSNFLYNNLFEGDELEVTTPFGDLVLTEGDTPILLASAGIGCTPMIGMLDHLADVATSVPSRSCTPTGRSRATPTVASSRPSPRRSRRPSCTAGTRTSATADRSRRSASDGPTSRICRSIRRPRPTCAVPCRSCSRCARL